MGGVEPQPFFGRLQMAENERKMELINTQIKVWDFRLAEDVIQFLIEKIEESELFEVLNKISTWQLLNHRECGVEQVKLFCRK